MVAFQYLDPAVETTAAAATKGGSILGMLPSLIPLVLIVVLMYFMLIRPQQKKQKEEAKMRNSLRVGDELITIGGVCGRVVSIKEDTVTIETGSDRTKITFVKTAIQTVTTKHDETVEDDDDDDDDI